MVVDGTTFARRAQRFIKELQANRYPNAVTLAKLCGCSYNTAQRVIYRLRDEYLLPIEYDSSFKGYYLIDPQYEFPSMLPAGKDELTSLLLAKDFIRHIDAQDLHENLEQLWGHFSANNSTLSHELEPLVQVFSSDSTVVADIADAGVLRYVQCAKSGESIRLLYKSPWRHPEPRTYEGRITRVHYSDGSLYLLFHERSGREVVLNTAFIKDFTVLEHNIPLACTPHDGGPKGSENWLEGFGIWAGDDLEQIEVKIAPPASEYYAAQRWHPDQSDTWEGDILVRRFPGIVSPELCRRVLSLGRFVTGLRPQALADMVIEDAWGLLRGLRRLERLSKIS